MILPTRAEVVSFVVPATLLLVGSSVGLLAWRRRRGLADDSGSVRASTQRDFSGVGGRLALGAGAR